MRNFAEQAMILAENQLQHTIPSCLIPTTASADLVNRSLSDWQSSVSCAGNFQAFQYYYVVEYLEEDPCALIESVSPALTAYYYRLTLIGWLGDTKTMLQSTVVTPRNTGVLCDGEKRIVTIGRQRLREIQ